MHLQNWLLSSAQPCRQNGRRWCTWSRKPQLDKFVIKRDFNRLSMPQLHKFHRLLTYIKRLKELHMSVPRKQQKINMTLTTKFWGKINWWFQTSTCKIINSTISLKFESF